jgi:hypothetical protein
MLGAPPSDNRRRVYLKTALGLLIICCSLIFLTIHGARIAARENALTSLGLGYCGDTPCFRGLIPGKTAWSIALATVGNRPISEFNSVAVEVTLAQTSDHALLDAISLDLPSTTVVTVADLITMYGTPRHVFVYPTILSWNVIRLHYPGLQVQTDLADGRLSPQSPIRHILLATSRAKFLSRRHGCMSPNRWCSRRSRFRSPCSFHQDGMSMAWVCLVPGLFELLLGRISMLTTMHKAARAKADGRQHRCLTPYQQTLVVVIRRKMGLLVRFSAMG